MSKRHGVIAIEKETNREGARKISREASNGAAVCSGADTITRRYGQSTSRRSLRLSSPSCRRRRITIRASIRLNESLTSHCSAVAMTGCKCGTKGRR